MGWIRDGYVRRAQAALNSVLSGCPTARAGRASFAWISKSAGRATMAYRDPETGRQRNRECFRRRTGRRRAQGLCLRCGQASPVTGRLLCEPCAAKRRKAEHAREVKRKALGKKRYTNPAKERVHKRQRYQQQTAERFAQGLCPKCGKEELRPTAACAIHAVQSVARLSVCVTQRVKPPEAVRGQGSQAVPQDRAEEKQGTFPCSPRRRTLHTLRPPAPHRGHYDVRALQRCPPRGGPRAIWQAAGRRPLRAMRRADRRRLALWLMRDFRGRTA